MFRQQDFPLNDALQEVLQQGATRARELRDAQQQLHTLQVRAHTHILLDIQLKQINSLFAVT